MCCWCPAMQSVHDRYPAVCSALQLLRMPCSILICLPESTMWDSGTTSCYSMTSLCLMLLTDAAMLISSSQPPGLMLDTSESIGLFTHMCAATRNKNMAKGHG